MDSNQDFRPSYICPTSSLPPRGPSAASISTVPDVNSALIALPPSLAFTQRLQLQLQTPMEQSTHSFQPSNEHESLESYFRFLEFSVELLPPWSRSSAVSDYVNDEIDAYYDLGEDVEGEAGAEEEEKANEAGGERVGDEVAEDGFLEGPNTIEDDTESNTESILDKDEIDQYSMDLACYFGYEISFAPNRFNFASTRASTTALEVARAVRNAPAIALEAKSATPWTNTYVELSIPEATQAAINATLLTSTADMAVSVAELLELHRRDTEETVQIAHGILEDATKLYVIAFDNAVERSATSLSQAGRLEEARATLNDCCNLLFGRSDAERRR